MTHEPVRLLHDPALAAVLRRDLGAVTNLDAGYDVAAGLARFEGNLAAGTAVAKTSASLSSGAIAAGTLLLVGGLTAAALLLWPGSEDPRTASAPASTPVSIAAAAPTTTTAPTTPIAAPPNSVPEEPSDAELVLDDPTPTSKPAKRRTRTAEPQAPDHDPAGPAQVDVLREARNLQAARSQLGHDATRALALAESGAAEFKGGTFAQEWEGVAILALFELGRPQARTRGEAFLRTYPSGTYAQRVRQALGDG